MFNTIVRWIVFSSQNPSQASLTIKGFLLGVLPLLMIVLGVAHIDIGQDTLTGIFDTVAQLTQVVLTVIAGVTVAWGLLRKLWATIKAHQEQQ